VLLLGGLDEDFTPLSTVHLVDLATGACAQQPNLLHPRSYLAAGRLPDGRVVCAGGLSVASSAEVWGPSEQGAPDAPWTWTELPAMSVPVPRHGCCGCVMSDGRFAVLGGFNNNNVPTSSCEALVVGGDANWEALSPLQDARAHFTCGAVAGCVIVAGGAGLKSAEVYDEDLKRWLRLPCDLPSASSILAFMGSAVL
jgi:hypothetical protein